MSATLAALTDLLQPEVEALGFVLWGIEYVPQGRHSVLRVYIDHANGIEIDDCETVSRQVSAVLDVEDPIRGEYVLEVSSPGMDRLLFNAEQFQQYCGECVAIRLRVMQEGKRRFQARLLSAEAEHITVECDGERMEIRYQDIEKARLQPDFSAGKSAK